MSHNMKKFEISESAINLIFGFLVKCPFEQVEPMVTELRNVVQNEIKEVAPDDKNLTKQ